MRLSLEDLKYLLVCLHDYDFSKSIDTNTGMYYLRARLYDTNSGRFATIDLHGGVFENPLTMNKYAYTSGAPISYNDLTGEFEGLADMLSQLLQHLRRQFYADLKCSRIL